MVGISEIKTKKDRKRFEQVPEWIHQKDPYFVPPFPGSICKVISPEGPFFQKHGEIHGFIAERDGQPVGRIAAIINRSHNKYHQDKVGFFGFFDCVDDPEVARELLTAAEKRLREKGLEVMRGPFNPSINDDIGLLTEGFNAAPFIMMPYNPAYYLGLYEGLQLAPVRDLAAFYMSAALEAPERIRKVVERIKRNSGVTLRSINLKKLPQELEIIHKLYNATLDRNWGFVPLALEDLVAFAKDLKSIANPEMVMIAEKAGVPMGFSLSLPNINEFLWKRKNSSRLMRTLGFAWDIMTSHPKEARLIILGVLPEYRHFGLGAIFYYESLMRSKGRYVGGELSWVEENNVEITKGITLMGGSVYKRYRIYEKPITLH